MKMEKAQIFYFTTHSVISPHNSKQNLRRYMHAFDFYLVQFTSMRLIVYLLQNSFNCN